MKKILLLSSFIFITFSFGVNAQQEGDIVISPMVIDEKVAPREILEYTIKLKSNVVHKLDIYPLVEDMIKEGDGVGEGMLDRQYKMSKWIRIKRNSISINPEGEIVLDLKIEVSHDAIPGDYFSSITFASGSNKPEAEMKAVKESPPKLIINLNVGDQSVEKLKILKYNPAKKVFVSGQPNLLLEINNSGNVPAIPTGNIFLYNKRGEEVDALVFNSDLKTMPAGQVSSFNVGGGEKLKTGKYKARLEIEYGNKSDKDITDTTYFIVITLPFMIFFGTGIILFIILLSILIFRKTYHGHHPQIHPNSHKNISKAEEKNEPIVVKKTGGEEAEIINLKKS